MGPFQTIIIVLALLWLMTMVFSSFRAKSGARESERFDKVCPQCGGQLAQGWNYCPRCGSGKDRNA